MAVQQYKLDRVAALQEKLQQQPDVLFTNYRGLNVAQITELRRRLDGDARLTVVRNSFAKTAFRALERLDVHPFLEGPTAIAFVTGDSVRTSKVLVEFGRDRPVEVRGAYIDGRVLSAEQVIALSRLPARDQLYSMLLAAMAGPMRGLVYCLNGVTQKLVGVLQAVSDKKKEG